MPNIILTKMVLKEVIVPLFFSMGAMILLFLVGKLFTQLEPLLVAGISFIEFLKLNLLMIPIFLYILIPICTLLGVLIAFIRFSKDSEIIALFSCGISPKELLVPLSIIAIIALISSFVVSAFIVPHAKKQTRLFMENITERALLRGIPERIFFNPIKDLTFFVDKASKDGRLFEGVYIRDARKDKNGYTILARSGKLSSDIKSGKVALKLFNGRLLRIGEDYELSDTIDFKKYVLSLTAQGPKNKLRRGEMTPFELYKASNKPNLKKSMKIKYRIEFHKRLGIPFGAFLLALLAAPLGIFFGKGGISTGICAGLSAFLAYYLAILLGTTLSQNGIFPPFLGVWIPNALLATATFLAFRPLFLKGPVIN